MSVTYTIQIPTNPENTIYNNWLVVGWGHFRINTMIIYISVLRCIRKYEYGGVFDWQKGKYAHIWLGVGGWDYGWVWIKVRFKDNKSGHIEH